MPFISQGSPSSRILAFVYSSTKIDEQAIVTRKPRTGCGSLWFWSSKCKWSWVPVKFSLFYDIRAARLSNARILRNILQDLAWYKAARLSGSHLFGHSAIQAQRSVYWRRTTITEECCANTLTYECPNLWDQWYTRVQGSACMKNLLSEQEVFFLLT